MASGGPPVSAQGDRMVDKQKPIMDFFDVQVWELGKAIEATVVYSHNPSTLWIVTKFRKLQILRLRMMQFYADCYQDLAMPKEEIVEGLICCVSRDGGFYRSRVVKVYGCCSTRMGVVVYFIDFGCLAMVNPNLVFILHDNFTKIPALAVRARIWNVRPFLYNTWALSEIEGFDNIIQNKTTICVIDYEDKYNRMLNIRLFINGKDNFGLKEVAIPMIRRNLAQEFSGILVKRMGRQTSDEINHANMLKDRKDYPDDTDSEDESVTYKPKTKGLACQEGEAYKRDKGPLNPIEELPQVEGEDEEGLFGTHDKGTDPLDLEPNITRYLRFLKPLHFKFENGLLPQTVYNADIRKSGFVDRHISRQVDRSS